MLKYYQLLYAGWIFFKKRIEEGFHPVTDKKKHLKSQYFEKR